MKQAFPPAFRELVVRLLRAVPRVRGERAQEGRTRRHVLSSSGTFAGHRAYTSGEDLRFVDWNAAARTGELILKVLEDDDRRTITVMLDTSASMTCGTPPRWRAALRLAAIAGGLALARLDGVLVIRGAERGQRLAGVGALPRLYELLDSAPVRDVSPRAFAEAVLSQRGPGRIIWISDFAEPPAFEPALAWLARRHLRVVGLLPMLADDEAPELGGFVRLRDPELGTEEVMPVDAPLRAAMVEELRALRRAQDRAFADAGLPLVRFPVPPEGDFRVSSWIRPWTSRV